MIIPGWDEAPPCPEIKTIPADPKCVEIVLLYLQKLEQMNAVERATLLQVIRLLATPVMLMKAGVEEPHP